MPRRAAAGLLLALASIYPARADVTIRRATSITVGPALPAQMQDAAKQQLASAVPPETVVRIKGSKAYTTTAQLITITDYATNQVILLNPKTKRYAKSTLSVYLEKVGAFAQNITQTLPPEAVKILEGMKFDVKTKPTGQTSVIQGIRADESLITIALGVPIGATIMPTIRMEMHLWTPQPSETERVAGLKELNAYVARNKDAMDPTLAVQKIFSQMPGLAEQLREPLAKLTSLNGNMILKMTAGVFMPALSQALPQLDPNTPMEELKIDLTELSTAPLDDSLFAVPAGYTAAPLETLIRSGMPPAMPPIKE
jgi:hypothetical protein